MTEKVSSNEVTWYCATCGETITHQHRPKKPDYQELLTTLREVDVAMRGTVYEDSITHEKVNEVLKRAEHGR